MSFFKSACGVVAWSPEVLPGFPRSSALFRLDSATGKHTIEAFTGAVRLNREAGAKPARSRRCNRGRVLPQATPGRRLGGRRRE